MTCENKGRKAICHIIAVSMALFLSATMIAAPSASAATPTTGFTDVTPSTPHYSHIMWAQSNGIAEGYENGDGTYRYEGMTPVYRQDMAAFLRRVGKLIGIQSASAYAPTEADWNMFTDVDKSTPHAEDILWLAKEGISNGYENGNGTRRFEGMTVVYRQDMAAFLYRMALKVGKLALPSGARNFTDVNVYNTPFYGEIKWLGGSGISLGYANGDGTYRFGLGLPVYRQDMAAFLHRLVTGVQEGWGKVLAETLSSGSAGMPDTEDDDFECVFDTSGNWGTCTPV